MNKILIIGIGNSGRQDDGLGWAFLEAIENELPENFDWEYRYQLQVEDAELISQYNFVLFVDADISLYKKGFNYQKLEPLSKHSYSSHQLSPASILDLAQHVYNSYPTCYTLGISGNDFQLKIGLSEFAAESLQKSISFFKIKFGLKKDIIYQD